MFGLFKSEPFTDDALGSFQKKSGYWIGSVALAPHGVVELRLAGDRKAPDASALLLARELSSRYASLLHPIEAALFDHYLPYAQANGRGEQGELEASVPDIADAKQIWPHVDPLYVSMERMQGVATVEIAYRVAWDEEHTVAARLQNWQFVELCGSV